jgi:hypothetical protein
MKVFKRGGFIILDDAGVEAPIPIPNFDYQIISDVVKMRDVAEQIGYSSSVASLQDESGTPVGNAIAIAAYFATLTNAESNQIKLLTQANDLVQTYTWLDGGTADQRISTIVYSSATLALTVTETFTYNGGAGTYHVATSTLS